MKKTHDRTPASRAFSGLRNLGIAMVVAGAGLAPGAFAADFTFRLSHQLQTSDATHIAMVSFSDAVKKRTEGRVEIQVFPADLLGRQKEVGEMIVQGANVMHFTDYLFIAEWVPDAGILQAPFLLDNVEDWYKLTASDWMKDLEARLRQKNIFVLSNNNYFGSRSIIGPTPVRKPADIAGKTLREAAAPLYIKTAESWGARPTVIGFAEVYTALSQGVVDFVECPPQTMEASKFTELRKVVSMTNHMITWAPVIVNDAAFHAMPEDLQKIVIEEAHNAGELVTKLKRDADVQMVETLKKAGVEVVEDIDREAFRQASLKVYGAFPEWTPGLGETVRAILAK